MDSEAFRWLNLKYYHFAKAKRFALDNYFEINRTGKDKNNVWIL